MKRTAFLRSILVAGLVIKCTAQCVASYTVAPNPGVNLGMVFNNTSTPGSYLGYVTYSTATLYFGDGVTTDYFFNVPDNTQIHTYPAPGNYTVPVGVTTYHQVYT